MPTILIVDDDGEDGEIFCDAVHEVELSINCIRVGNCQEALGALKTQPKPDLIFMDLYMPGIDGLQCIGEIKKDRSFQNIPIVIYSAKQGHDQSIAQDSGAAYFIEKPSSFTELRQILQQIFEKEMILNKQK